MTAQFFAAFGFFFIVLQYLQFIVGRSPLQAALTLVPLPLILIPTARVAPKVAERLGTNRVGAAGLVSIAIGLGVISRLGVSFDNVTFYVGLGFFGLGMGLAGTPATTAITSSLPESKQGVASAVNDLSRELGSALGIAVLGSMLTTGYRDGIAPALTHLPHALADGARSSVAFVQSDAVHRLGPAADRLVGSAQQAFVDGVSAAVLTGAGVALVAAAYVFFRAPGRNAEVPAAASEDRVEVGQPG
jgi:Na+/melibiose symporter-like transporter